MCQEDQACQQGCRCPEGRCSLRARQGGSAGRREPWGVGISSGGPSPHRVPGAGWWSVCPSSIAECADAQGHSWAPGASTRRLQQLHVPGGGSSLRPSPARLLPTAPGAAGQPGVPAAARVGLQGSRAASGTGAVPGLCHLTPPGPPAAWTQPLDCWGSWILSLLVTLYPPVTGLGFGPWSSLPFLSHLHTAWASPGGGGNDEKGPGPSLTFSAPGLHPGLPHRARGPRCREEQSQSQPCPPAPCPPLCLQGTRPLPGGQLAAGWMPAVVNSGAGAGANREVPSCWAAASLSLGSSFSSCTPEGIICER